MKPAVEKSLLADLTGQLERMKAERDQARRDVGRVFLEREDARALNRELARALDRECDPIVDRDAGYQVCMHCGRALSTSNQHAPGCSRAIVAAHPELLEELK